MVVDYISRYIEITRLVSTTSQAIIKHLKSMFARHGIPEVLVSDNGLQYASAVIQKFSYENGFLHSTSSPHYPQGNGETERGVQTVERRLQNSSDPYLALLAYLHASLLRNGCSPAEQSIERKIRTTNLTPRGPDLEKVKLKEEMNKAIQKDILTSPTAC
ncbi:uncharacterized protein K02A2.6-like [Mizuhopecten yessoensis]|uniref:uncharacterized protein K02A2.6-like n=1 Tax=Mizuhopecten yessoensis TaxID=6573 RepID=UPI000B45B372|nr:uncharacterized protein K02A2.6-like [Mizuhopecten yessoensis]